MSETASGSIPVNGSSSSRLDGRLLDVVRRIEVGLACAEADHVLAFGLKFPRLLRDCDRGRRFDPLERFRNRGGHGRFSRFMARLIRCSDPGKKGWNGAVRRLFAI